MKMSYERLALILCGIITLICVLVSTFLLTFDSIFAIPVFAITVILFILTCVLSINVEDENLTKKGEKQ